MIDLALAWSGEKLVVETDCSTLVHMIKELEANISQIVAVIGDTMQQLATRQHEIMAIKREQNKVSHALAMMGRSMPKTAMWLRCAPNEVDTLC